MKNKSTFLNNCYEWLFSEEEKDSVPQYSLIASFNEAAIRRSKNDFYAALDIYNEIIKNIQVKLYVLYCL